MLNFTNKIQVTAFYFILLSKKKSVFVEASISLKFSIPQKSQPQQRY